MAKMENGLAPTFEDVDQGLTYLFFIVARLDVRSAGGAQCQTHADQRIGGIDARLPDEQGHIRAA